MAVSAPSIYEVSAAYDVMLRAREAQAVSALTAYFARSIKFIEHELADITSRRNLTADPAEARLAYERGLITTREYQASLRTPSPAWDYQENRLRSLLSAFERQQSFWLRDAGTGIHKQVLSAAELGYRYGSTASAFEVVGTRIGAPVQLSASFKAVTGAVGLHDTAGTAAVRALAAAFADESPLMALINDATGFGGYGTDLVKGRLLKAAALGLSPRSIAQEVAAGLGSPLARGLTVARTEVLRAYREGTRAAWEGNALVKEWEWRSARDTTTCAVCWAMDGRRFPTAEPMATHPNCRCTMLPVIPSLKEMGEQRFMGFAPKGLQTSAQREALAKQYGLEGRDARWPDFRGLSESAQRAILGPTRFEAWKAGNLPLDKWVSIPKVSGPYGRVPRLRTLSELGFGPGGAAPVPVPKVKRPPKPKPEYMTGTPEPWDSALSPLLPNGSRTPTHEAMHAPVPWTTVAVDAWGREAYRWRGPNGEDAATQAKQDIAEDLARRMEKLDDLLAQIDDLPRHFSSLFYPDSHYPFTASMSWAQMSKAERLAFLKTAQGKMLREKVASDFIHQWANTSADHSDASLLMQLAAEKALGIKSALTSHFSGPDLRDARAYLDKPIGRYMQEFVKASYAATQAFYKAHGITHVWVYRGQTSNPPGLVWAPGQTQTTVTGHFQPMSSWSTEEYTARGFGSYLFYAKIPVSWVIGSAKTGWGCLSEGELVIAGGKFDCVVRRV